MSRGVFALANTLFFLIEGCALVYENKYIKSTRCSGKSSKRI